MKKSQIILAFMAVFLCIGAVHPREARAQYIGNVGPVTTQVTLGTNVACTGSAQNFTTGVTPKFDNLGQTQHFVTLIGAAVSLQAVINGLDNAGNPTQISDTGYTSAGLGVGNTLNLVGSGYYPNIQVQVTCFTGTFTLSYSGSWGTPTLNVGAQLQTQVYKPIFTAAPDGSSQFATLSTPFGSTAGYIVFAFTPGMGPTGSTITVNCNGVNAQPIVAGTPFALAQSGTQIFYIPPLPCYSITVAYLSGAPSPNTFTMTYQFLTPGTINVTEGLYGHITGTTATAVKATGGTFLGVNINTSAAGTISVFDLAGALCVMTPVSNIVAVITVNATDPPHATPFNVAMQNGICLKASVAMDLTASFQ